MDICGYAHGQCDETDEYGGYCNETHELEGDARDCLFCGETIEPGDICDRWFPVNGEWARDPLQCESKMKYQCAWCVSWFDGSDTGGLPVKPGDMDASMAHNVQDRQWLGRVEFVRKFATHGADTKKGFARRFPVTWAFLERLLKQYGQQWGGHGGDGPGVLQ